MRHPLHRKLLLVSQGMIRRKHRQKRVPVQGNEAAPSRAAGGGEADVGRAGCQPLGHIVIISRVQPELHAGMGFPKGFEDPREPVHRHAGKGSHHHGAPLPAPEIAAEILDPFLGLQQGFDLRQKELSLLRQPNAGSAAVQQAHPKLLFQAGDHLTHGGLGAAQRFGGPAEAAALHGPDKEAIAFQIHLLPLFLSKSQDWTCIFFRFRL